MRREERFMNILGGLDEKYVALAMPGSCGHGAVGDTGNVTDIKPVEGNIGITKKERVMYIITRAVVIAAALALIADGALWLWSNWDKIAVSGNYRPGAVTVVSENEPTPVTDEIVYKYEGCTVKVKEYEFDGLTAKVIYEEIFDKDPGYDLQPRVAPCIADSDKEFSGKPFKLIKKDGLVYIWEKSCTQYEPSDEITLAFTDRSVSFEDHKAMQNDPAYSLVISKGLVPARVIETYKAIPLTAGNVNMKAVYICENTVTVKCEPSGLTGDELVELAEADIKIIMADGYEVLFALEPNTVNPVMETADGHTFTGRYNAGHIDTSMISSVSINGVLIWDNTADRFERITDTSMPEPFLPAETNWGARDFNAGWDIKFGDRQTAAQKDLIDMAEPGERGEYLKEAEKLYDTETPCTLYDNVNDLSCAKIMGLTNDELTEMIERRNKYYSELDLEDLKQNIYSNEDLYMLASGSDEKIAAYFASEYSVVVGENVFSPRWLYYHTAEDYKAAGIKPNAMNSLLERYVELGLTEEAWRAFRKKLILYAYSEMSPEKDRVYTYETDVSEPLGDEAFRIFEDYFYGEWEFISKYVNSVSTFDMTYNGSSFRFGRILGIFETDEIYVLHYNSGGTLECYVIEKSSPEIMYQTDVLPSLGGIEEIKLGDDEWVKFIDRKPAAAELKTGELSIPGLTYLFHIYGSAFEDYYRSIADRDSYRSISDEEELYLGDGYVLDNFTQYLVDMSEDSVTVALPYVHDKQGSHETAVYYELTFTKDEKGEWSVEYNRSDEAQIQDLF